MERRTNHLRARLRWCAVASAKAEVLRHRRRVLAPLLAIVTLACSGGPERAVLDRFFQASRLRDLTALENVSTVIFEPRQDGTVLSYEITSIRQTADDSEEVLVSAIVRLPSGTEQQRPLVVTLKRVKERWMVAAVHVSTESTSPASPPR